MALGTEVGLGSGHTVLGGHPAAPPKGHRPPNFRPMSINCDQTAGWIKMPLGTFGRDVDLGPGNIVLCSMLTQLRQRSRVPQFSADVCYCVVARRLD